MQNKESEINVSIETPSQLLLQDNSLEIDTLIFEIDSGIKLLTPKADKIDYLIAVASGLLCGALDVLWVGEFDLFSGKEKARKSVDSFVMKVAERHGWKDKGSKTHTEKIQAAVAFLEKKFQMIGDTVTDEFGGARQHHLRDFSHHFSPVGLYFSILGQFTGQTYGTGTDGSFIRVDIAKENLWMIGETIPEKLCNGIINWFFHLVSDMAGSKNTAGLSGGTGIPGPILSLVKEISSIPFFHDANNSEKISKLFNGTLFAKRDANGKIIKESVLGFDLRTEMGVIFDLGKQSLPVIANDIFVRAFYLFRHLFSEIKEKEILSVEDLSRIDFDNIKPSNNPTIDRMLTISSSVFTTVDICSELIKNAKYGKPEVILAVTIKNANKAGLIRVGFAIKKDFGYGYKRINLKRIKKAFEKEKLLSETEDNVSISYDRLKDLDLTIEQIEITFSLEACKVLLDIERAKQNRIKKDSIQLMEEWYEDWKNKTTSDFSTLVSDNHVKLHWYSPNEILQLFAESSVSEIWFTNLLIEVISFVPFFPLSLEVNSKGKESPSKKYSSIQKLYKKETGDCFLEGLFKGQHYYETGYVGNLRKTYTGIMSEILRENAPKVLAMYIPVMVLGGAILCSTVYWSSKIYSSYNMQNMSKNGESNNFLTNSMNTWLAQEFFSPNGFSSTEILFLLTKLLVVTDIVLLSKRKDVQTAKTIDEQIKKTIRTFRKAEQKINAEGIVDKKIQKSNSSMKKETGKSLRILENAHKFLNKRIKITEKEVNRCGDSPSQSH